MSRFWITLGVGIEVVHLAFTLGVMMFGFAWMSRQLWRLLNGLTLCLQALCLGCPLTLLANACFRYGGLGYETGTLQRWLAHALCAGLVRGGLAACGAAMIASAVWPSLRRNRVTRRARPLTSDHPGVPSQAAGDRIFAVA